MRAFLCLFGDDTLGVVQSLVDSQNVVQIKISEPNIIANSPWSISVLSHTTLLVLVRRVSNCMMHTQAFTILQVSKLENSCLKLKFGGTGNLIGVLMQYEILKFKDLIANWMSCSGFLVLFWNSPGHRHGSNQLFGVRILWIVDDISGQAMFDNFTAVHHCNPISDITDDT